VRPLTIDTSFVSFTPAGRITVSGLTFENGLGTTVGGLKVSDSGPITNASVLIEGNIFRNNVATAYQPDNSAGALLAATDGSDGTSKAFLVVRNNLFVGNSAPDAAAAMLFSNGSIDFSNNTVTGNQPNDASLALRSSVETFTFSGVKYSSNVFWNNNAAALQETFDLRAEAAFAGSGFHAADLFNNDVQAVHGTPATDQDNKSVDPKFAAPAHADFRLSAASPLIDAGLDAPDGGLAVVDLDGAPRLQDLHVDIGAYESGIIFHDGFD